MKKFALATLIALAVGSASAVELGVTTTRDYSQSPDRNGYGISLGEKFGKTGVTGGFERYTKGAVDLDRYSLVVGYDVAKVGVFTITPKVGVAYLQPQVGQTGYAATVGVGTSIPLNKTVSLTADYRHQIGQDRVNQYDGNTLTAGVKVSF